MRDGVATCDDTNTILRELPPDQSVNEASLFAHDQNDVPRDHLVLTHRLDGQQVTGPQRGKHAHSPCPQANFAAAAKRLDCKVELEKFSVLRLAIFRRRWRRDMHVKSYGDEIYTGNL
jgi:hypothetical protein